jgi:hypothetical protein
MIRFPNRLAGMIPLRTHLHTVATDTSNSFATCFVVMYLFVIMNPTAIYTRSESDASGAAPGSVALRSWMVAAGRMFPLRKMFPFCFHFGRTLSRGVPMVSKDVSNVSIFSEEF